MLYRRIFTSLVNDQGDAKFKSFAILPAQGRIGTKFSIDFVFVSKNRTSTGEIIITVHTLDKVRVSGGFLLEAQKPGTYGDRVVVDATPDPECDPDESRYDFVLLIEVIFFVIFNRSM